MAYELRNNTGSLFKNDKRKTDNHPNARGQCRIDGVDYWVSAWTKRTRAGDPWQSLAFEKKDEQPRRRDEDEQEYERDRMAQEIDDEIPF